MGKNFDTRRQFYSWRTTDLVQGPSLSTINRRVRHGKHAITLKMICQGTWNPQAHSPYSFFYIHYYSCSTRAIHLTMLHALPAIVFHAVPKFNFFLSLSVTREMPWTRIYTRFLGIIVSVTVCMTAELECPAVLDSIINYYYCSVVCFFAYRELVRPTTNQHMTRLRECIIAD